MTSTLRIALLVMSCCVACLVPTAVECDFGTCTAGLQCDEVHKRCVTAAQLTDCIGKPLETACSVNGREGVCVDEVCLDKGCGDTLVNGAERCDGTTFITTSTGVQATGCADLGYYEDGPISCRSDCTIDESVCLSLGFCGDGVRQEAANELCDYNSGEAGATCGDLGWYRGGEAACTTLCSYDISGCSGRCGDGIVDAPQELCEPTSGLPSYLSCVSYGFDGGVLACGNACTPDLAVCTHHGLWPVGSYAFNPLDIWQASALEAFVVGHITSAGGLVLRWDGSQLTPVAPAEGGILLAVSGSSATDVIAVGQAGRITRYDGNALVEMTSPVTGDLRGVHVRAANEAYAVGIGGTVLSYDGLVWTRDMTFPSPTPVDEVFATSSTDVWVSTFVGPADSRLYRRSGTTWSLARTFETSIAGIWGTSATNVYVVTRPPNPELWHFDGAWNVEPVTNRFGSPLAFRDISGSAADNIVAVGDLGAFAHFNGQRWTVIDGGATGSMTAVGAHDLRSAVALTLAGQVVRWEGVGWTPSDAPFMEVARGMWGSSQSSLFAATATFLRRYDPAFPPANNSHWTSVGGVAILSEVWGASESDVWAVGESNVFHYTSGGRTATDLSTLVPSIYASDISGAAGTRFVLGHDALSDETVVFSDASGSFTVLHTILGQLPSAIWAHAPNSVWVATQRALHHYDGVVWTLVHEDPNTNFNDIWGTAANDVWAVGTGGVVVHYDGTSWTTVPVQTTRTLSRIHGTSASDIFVGGDETLLHFDGTRWTPLRLPLAGTTALWATEHDIAVWSQSGMRFLHRACLTCL